MDKFKEILKSKDKKTLVNLSIALAAGVMLIVLSGIFSQNGGNAEKNESLGAGIVQETYATAMGSYETELEKRLEEALGLIDGAGAVKVMLTLANGREIVVAENTDTSSKTVQETDTDGGTRKTEETKLKSDIIILSQRGGESEPLVIKEITPKVEGVIIIAEGADNIIVKDALTRAAQAALGADIHKIQVLKMKEI